MFISTQDPQPTNNNALCTPEPTKLVKPLQSAFMSTGLLSKRNRPRPKAPYSAFAATTRISTNSHQPDTPCKRGPHANFVIPSLPSTPVAFALPTPSTKRPVPSPSPSRSNGPNKRHINDHRVAAKPNLSLASLGAAVPDSPAPPTSRHSRPEVRKLDLTRVSTSQSDPIDADANVPTSTKPEPEPELLTPTKMNFDLASPVTERRLLESPKRTRARHSTPPQIDSIAQNLFLPQRQRSSSPPFHISKATAALTPNDWREHNTFSRNASSHASSSISDSELEGSIMLTGDSSDSDMSDFEEKTRFRKHIPRRAGDIFYSDDEGDGMRSRKDSGIGVSHTSRGSPKMRIIPTPSCPSSPVSYSRQRASGGSMRSHSMESYITPFARILGPGYFDLYGNKDKKEGSGRLIIPDPSAFISTSRADNMSTESYFESSFTVLEELGSGEFSTVYKVQDIASGNVYAIKRMSQPFSGARDRLRRLEEVEIMWLLGQNPHVVELVNAWEQEGHLYLQTELCENGTLAGLLDLAENEGIGERVVWRCLAELAQGLSHIHNCGILHLDLKPANILITSFGALKIGDFGLAIRMPVAAGAEREGDREYMAQEVLSEARLTPAADVFSLGLITLEMAANIILPDNGPEWHRLRSGDLGGVKFENVSDSLIHRIAEMLQPEPVSRPVVNDILSWPEIQQAIAEGKSAFEEFIIYPDDQEELWFGALPSDEQKAKSPRTPEGNMTP